MRSCLKHWTKPAENTGTLLWPSGLDWVLSNLSSASLLSFSPHNSARQDGTICFMFRSLPFVIISPSLFLLHLSSAPLRLICLSSCSLHRSCARLKSVYSELHTLFHHINFTSPLKDWPHTKLLFKGKKYTRQGWRGVAGCVCTKTRTRISPQARQYRKWSTPPQGWQIISLCHEASPCVQVISSEAAFSATAAPLQPPPKKKELHMHASYSSDHAYNASTALHLVCVQSHRA